MNGGFGVGVENGAPAFEKIAENLPKHGVLRFLPTLVSSPPSAYSSICEEHKAWTAKTRPGSARSLGLHLEGPLLSMFRNGAHWLASIESASFDVVDAAISSGQVRIITCAPEREGVLDAIERWSARGVVVALGHSRASSSEAALGMARGATLVTHLFNAMGAFHHRSPGLIGVALLHERSFFSLIADGHHVDPLAARIAIRAGGHERVILISDSSPAAGAGPGTFLMGGVEAFSDGASVRLADGTLAGSALFLDRMVALARRWCEVGLARAVAMATENPATLLGASDWGKIENDYLADLVVLGADTKILRVIDGGVELSL
jgi:N-acetylglucosamine-6-phosphate deacetylase